MLVSVQNGNQAMYMDLVTITDTTEKYRGGSRIWERGSMPQKLMIFRELYKILKQYAVNL